MEEKEGKRMEGMTILLVVIAGVIPAFILGYYVGNVRGYLAGMQMAAEAILDEEEEKMQEAFGPDGGWR